MDSSEMIRREEASEIEHTLAVINKLLQITGMVAAHVVPKILVPSGKNVPWVCRVDGWV